MTQLEEMVDSEAQDWVNAYSDKLIIAAKLMDLLLDFRNMETNDPIGKASTLALEFMNELEPKGN